MISQSSRTPAGVREHHITSDYGYVRQDLITVVVVTGVALAFVVAMSFVL